ncbi:AbiV family abortive infection protein [Demequina gelatinilytica]|uniref:AbiV family abortive infection protein n=1 Tax=Demequina gelatinilytica TaxID=1638980 RepID=UPI00078312F8|nr:AbiV family abortive infection protein [Demequina gelatinilytica]
MTAMTPKRAREFFWALVENAIALVEDAALLESQSPARAQSLLVLAYEEVGKASWVLDAFWRAWEDDSDDVRDVKELSAGSRHHGAKYLGGREFSMHLPIPYLWHSPDEMIQLGPMAVGNGEVIEAIGEPPDLPSKIAARANEAKQRGLYVDLDREGVVRAPKDAEVIDLVAHRGHVAASIVTLIYSYAFLVLHDRDTEGAAQALLVRAEAHARDEDYA